jgi:EAL domain-containing protein (putative c-di-GMP-specific phosphodiesterase class I)
VARFKTDKLFATVLGILVVAGPVLWISTWLQKRGETEISVAASWTLGNFEAQIDRTVAVLDELAERGIEDCGAANLERLGRGLALAPPVKELSLLADDGRMLCTDRGISIARPEVLASVATANPDIVLEVVRPVASAEPVLRVRRLLPSRSSLAASLPAELLLPQVAPDGTRFVGYARIALADGTVVGTTEPHGSALASETLDASRVQSERYGVVVTATTGQDRALATTDDLRRVGIAVTGLLGLIVLAATVILPWRDRKHPFYDLDRAIGAGELVPYYQPIVDIKSGAIVVAEVLVRWRQRDGSLVLPVTFIPFLESTDTIVDMTRSIMRQACEDVGELLERRPHMYVTFNVAPRHLVGDLLVDDIGSIFIGGPISTSQIVLEITERYQIEDLAATRELIMSLQGLGCRVAIDDVGTGHNGLTYILKLGVDIIKIDKIFVDAIRTEAHCRAIVDTLVDLARNMRMQIVAEGVEDFEQVEFLRDRGIGLAQGYVFAPPLPGSAFVQLIETIDPAVPAAPNFVIAGEGPGEAATAPRHAAA